jgi:hypothetical protein
VLASAAVEGYLQDDNHEFLRKTQDVPDFAVDLLREVKVALTVDECSINMTSKDPFSGQMFQLRGDWFLTTCPT